MFLLLSVPTMVTYLRRVFIDTGVHNQGHI